jgi:hypothetical protein
VQVLGGNWDPYPIDMSFLPPVMTFSTIGLNQPGKIERGVRCEDCEKHLHQLHVCLPAKPGHTRLLYRMSLDFMDWLKHVPGIQKVFTHNKLAVFRNATPSDRLVPCAFHLGVRMEHTSLYDEVSSSVLTTRSQLLVGPHFVLRLPSHTACT